MRSRRSRYIIKFSGRDPVEALAYSPEQARQHFERRGYIVVSVTRTSKPKPRPSGARINRAALRQAIEILGIEMPVEIKFNGRQGHTNGNHQAQPVGPGVVISGSHYYGIEHATGWKHRIMLKSYLSAEDMGRTLWHELAHAMQWERDALARGGTPLEILTRWKRAYNNGTAYTNKPYEVEARAYEARNEELPLALDNR